MMEIAEENEDEVNSIPSQVLENPSIQMSDDSIANEPILSPVNQWTDESGYTWRMMNNDSLQWWDGSDWQDHT